MGCDQPKTEVVSLNCVNYRNHHQNWIVAAAEKPTEALAATIIMYFQQFRHFTWSRLTYCQNSWSWPIFLHEARME